MKTSVSHTKPTFSLGQFPSWHKFSTAQKPAKITFFGANRMNDDRSECNCVLEVACPLVVPPARHKMLLWWFCLWVARWWFCLSFSRIAQVQWASEGMNTVIQFFTNQTYSRTTAWQWNDRLPKMSEKNASPQEVVSHQRYMWKCWKCASNT